MSRRSAEKNSGGSLLTFYREKQIFYSAGLTNTRMGGIFTAQGVLLKEQR
jgi:hypothetical protein